MLKVGVHRGKPLDEKKRPLETIFPKGRTSNFFLMTGRQIGKGREAHDCLLRFWKKVWGIFGPSLSRESSGCVQMPRHVLHEFSVSGICRVLRLMVGWRKKN
jgi:hypothetical protein